MQKYKEAYYKLFASVSETIDLIEDILPQITDKETKNRVISFMKGKRELPY